MIGKYSNGNFCVFVSACNLKPHHLKCQTENLLIEGAHGWTPTMYIRLVQDFGLECEVAQHLANAYGDRAFAVAKLASLTGKRWPIIGTKLHPEFPYIDAEVRQRSSLQSTQTLKKSFLFLWATSRCDMLSENTPVLPST